MVEVNSEIVRHRLADEQAWQQKEFEEIASHGAKLLDYVDSVEEIPADSPKAWFMRIDTGKLNLMDVKDCILGQLYGSYFTGLDIVATLVNDFKQDVELIYRYSDPFSYFSIRFGFEGSQKPFDHSYIAHYWIREIETRKHKLVKENAME